MDKIPNGASACGIDVEFQKQGVSVSGFGERMDGMNLGDGNELRSENQDSFSNYGHAQLVVAHAPGYSLGVYWSNPSDTFLKMQNQDNIKAARFVSEGGFADLFLFPMSARNITECMVALTGTPMMPPTWASGYHQCKYGYGSEATVLDVLDGFDSSKLPMDCLWLDIDHLKNHSAFEWDYINWPKPK
jgi:alpha 1,3-glucosidase